MKFFAAALIIAGSCLLSASANAQSADDTKWVAQCLVDNANAKVAQTVVAAYCTCMNSRMPDSTNQSITQWEQSHPVDKAACEKASGWN